MAKARGAAPVAKAPTPRRRGKLDTVVNVKAGAAQKGLMFKLPMELSDATVAQVLEYVTTHEWNERAQARIAHAVGEEMGRGDYGITANRQGVSGNTALSTLLEQRKARDGRTPYQGVDLVVAAQQTGGALSALERIMYRT